MHKEPPISYKRWKGPLSSPSLDLQGSWEQGKGERMQFNQSRPPQKHVSSCPPWLPSHSGEKTFTINK